MANIEFSTIIDSIKYAYEKTIEDKIDITHIIKDTIFQEFYNLQTVSLNYCEYKNEHSDILELLLKGEIYI